MICKKCEKKPIAKGIKFTMCHICGLSKTINVAYRNICAECSSQYNKCQCCGESIVVNLLKDKVEQLLFEYMDGINFEDGYIPDLFNVKPLRDDIIKLINDIKKGE